MIVHSYNSLHLLDLNYFSKYLFHILVPHINTCWNILRYTLYNLTMLELTVFGSFKSVGVQNKKKRKSVWTNTKWYTTDKECDILVFFRTLPLKPNRNALLSTENHRNYKFYLPTHSISAIPNKPTLHYY